MGKAHRGACWPCVSLFNGWAGVVLSGPTKRSRASSIWKQGDKVIGRSRAWKIGKVLHLDSLSWFLGTGFKKRSRVSGLPRGSGTRDLRSWTGEELPLVALVLPLRCSSSFKMGSAGMVLWAQQDGAGPPLTLNVMGIRAPGSLAGGENILKHVPWIWNPPFLVFVEPEQKF